MNLIRNLSLRSRLALGFGLLIALMLAIAGLGVQRFAHTAEAVEDIVGNQWVKASAATSIDIATRANARRTMELFFATDPAHAARVRDLIETNKKGIDEALVTLGQRVTRPDGKALLATLTTARVAYVASFSKVDQLLRAGQREQAQQLLLAETLPRLDALQGHVGAMTKLQQRIAAEEGAAVVAEAAATRHLLIGAAAVALALGALSTWWLGRAISRPIERAVQVAEAVAAGDLTSRITATSRDETGRLLRALSNMNVSLATVVTQVRASSESIATGSGQIAAGTADLSQRTEEQASNLQQTAASMEQLAGIVRQNADTAQQASGLAGSSASAVVEGGVAVGRVVETMGEITAASRRIGDIVGVIEGLAFQTNILALNAAVEAARAGEHGRGFAVVAAEVRTLAQRSATSAREIKALVESSVERVEAGNALAGDAGRTMQGVVQRVQRVSELIAQISAAAVEQTQGIEQVNTAVTQLDQVTQQNAALVEESAAASESLNQQASRLVDSVRGFRLEGTAQAA
jgi:methyl-accepting chemotaxis protein